MTTTLPPLAERIRPRRLEEYVGQEHLIGPQGAITKCIATGNLPSLLLWGPPGVGKTTLALLMAQTLERPFFALSAINSGVKEVREVLNSAQINLELSGIAPVLFIDEIHRFSKSQQDALLGAVEKGIITLVGATTENPSFEVISALLSRCQVYILHSLTEANLLALIEKAIKTDTVLSTKAIEIVETDGLLRLSGGDGRKLLNLLELVCSTQASTESSTTEQPLRLTNALVQQCAQQNLSRYDKTGENHYDIISAFIKSVRGSDPNAAVYWLARMIEGGEDPSFIARRLLILASEDIGNANPTGLMMANNCFQAVNVIGYPEARIILAQCTTYLACSPKSNASYKAINEAQQAVKHNSNYAVPLALRNAPTTLMEEIGYGQEYKYPHQVPGAFIPQEYLPEQLKGTVFYQPGKNPREEETRKLSRHLWGQKYGY